ncbi:MAG: hypothetical protein VXZ72_01810, partial [Chlamydiota bacterium]|nr:hypothetical protein [Chlamydiota bacterium]
TEQHTRWKWLHLSAQTSLAREPLQRLSLLEEALVFAPTPDDREKTLISLFDHCLSLDQEGTTEKLTYLDKAREYHQSLNAPIASVEQLHWMAQRYSPSHSLTARLIYETIFNQFPLNSASASALKLPLLSYAVLAIDGDDLSYPASLLADFLILYNQENPPPEEEMLLLAFYQMKQEEPYLAQETLDFLSLDEQMPPQSIFESNLSIAKTRNQWERRNQRSPTPFSPLSCLTLLKNLALSSPQNNGPLPYEAAILYAEMQTALTEGDPWSQYVFFLNRAKEELPDNVLWKTDYLRYIENEILYAEGKISGTHSMMEEASLGQEVLAQSSTHAILRKRSQTRVQKMQQSASIAPIWIP